ncbi:MAG: KilA-N domain-containing protein [Mangrovibacterium sp.]
MSKKEKITVQGTEITIISEKNSDYISLTDMVKGQEGDDLIRNWMRNRNTLEFLGAWETLHNPIFKGVEFDTFLHEAGANRFNMTPRKWVEATDAVGITTNN